MKLICSIALMALLGPACATASKKTYAHWPKVPTAPVAVGAAAAAAIATLANPKAAGRKEHQGPKKKRPTAKRGEQMPSTILDQMDERGNAATKDRDAKPCAVAEPAPVTGDPIPLIPVAPRAQPGCTDDDQPRREP